jgi:signal transduction histidine kinase
MSLRRITHFLLLWLLMPACSVMGAELPSTLTRIADIRRLSRDEAAKAMPVKISGVSLWTYKGAVVVDDGDKSIWVDWGRGGKHGLDGFNPEFYKPGNHLEIEGVTGPGGYAPVVVPHRIRHLGTLPLTEAERVPVGSLLSGSEDAQRVEIEGVVQDVHPSRHGSANMMLSMITDGHFCRVLVTDGSGLDENSLIDAKVRVRGIFAPDHNFRAEVLYLKIFTNSVGDIEVLNPPPADPFLAPRVPLHRLAPFSPESRPWHRKVISGTVIFAVPGKYFFLQDGDTSVRVNSESSSVQPGQRVEVAGFVDRIDNLSALKNGLVRAVGMSPLPEPLPVTATMLLKSQGNRRQTSTTDAACRMVVMRGQLQRVDWQKPGIPKTVWIETEDHLFPAYPQLGSAMSQEQIRTWQPGAKLEVTGVCELKFGTIGEYPPQFSPVAFHLLLPSSSSIRILELPAWWTLGRTRIALGGIALALLLVLVWTHTLRRQVAKQSRLLAEKERVAATNAERVRIARDIHDDMGAGLTEIAMLSDLAMMDRHEPVALATHLERIFRASRDMTQVLDQIIWFVNPGNNSLDQLLAFTSELAQTLLTTAGIRCRLDLPPNPQSLPVSSRIRHQICMAFKETLHNIIKHSRANEVSVRASIDNAHVLTLEIQDDGIGFDPARDHAADGTHDGLLNMHLRMREIGGTCVIDSSPGQGTRVLLQTKIQP